VHTGTSSDGVIDRGASSNLAVHRQIIDSDHGTLDFSFFLVIIRVGEFDEALLQLVHVLAVHFHEKSSGYPRFFEVGNSC